jgi:hypothetical protein
MKILIPIAAFVFCLVGFVSVSAQQQGDPPAPAPEYSPKSWKEYTFADDSVRFRFPVEPVKEETVTGTAKLHKFRNSTGSFLYLRLDVISAPDGLGTDAKLVLKSIEEGLLAGMKNFEPKIIKNEETAVDGNAGKFIQVETNDGRVMRYKIFVAGNKVYTAAVAVAKGKQHGFNWENDFEVPAMAFLDSIHVIVAK